VTAERTALKTFQARLRAERGARVEPWVSDRLTVSAEDLLAHGG
jgi:hypothetical protein